MLGLSWFLAYKRKKLGHLRGEELVEAKEGASLDCKREDPLGGNCKTRENSNFWKNGKIVISVKT